jgi:serine/threonine protein kinase
MADRIGQQLGNYRLTHLLGRGGFAEVYLGKHVRLKTRAAIKVLHAHLAEAEVVHFQQEAETIARLTHPHIVRVLDYDVAEGVPFLVMDYAPNGTLRQRFPKGSQQAPGALLPYVRQVAEALHYAHDQQLIHRDVKPENMLLGERNQVLLSDFGIALIVQSSRSQPTEELAGTLAYMAPEQIRGHPRPESDQYSLAVVLYEWLSGEHPVPIARKDARLSTSGRSSGAGGTGERPPPAF